MLNKRLNPAGLWVLSGEGTPTIQYDGFGYAVLNGKCYRHCVTRTPPPDFLYCGTAEGKWWGWEIVPTNDPLWWPVWQGVYGGEYFEWSYELLNGKLYPHGKEIIHALKGRLTIETLGEYLRTHSQTEGIVWWQDIWELQSPKVKLQQGDIV